MKLLDVFCGAGGASMGYAHAGFEIVGVDLFPQPNYPFEFVQADALEFLRGSLDEFDVIHASPPCQAYSTKTKDKSRHPDLIAPVRELLERAGRPWVIENVEQAPLVNPIRLCGSSFGLGVRRHRLFESSVRLFDLPCRHGWQRPRFEVYDHGKWYLAGTVPVFGTGGGKARSRWSEAMGIDWMTDEEMAEAIPPAYTKYLGAQLIAYLESRTKTKVAW